MSPCPRSQWRRSPSRAWATCCETWNQTPITRPECEPSELELEIRFGGFYYNKSNLNVVLTSLTFSTSSSPCSQSQYLAATWCCCAAIEIDTAGAITRNRCSFLPPTRVSWISSTVHWLPQCKRFVVPCCNRRGWWSSVWCLICHDHLMAKSPKCHPPRWLFLPSIYFIIIIVLKMFSIFHSPPSPKTLRYGTWESPTTTTTTAALERIHRHEATVS